MTAGLQEPLATVRFQRDEFGGESLCEEGPCCRDFNLRAQNFQDFLITGKAIVAEVIRIEITILRNRIRKLLI